MNGIDYLEKSLQDYVQYGVENKIHITKSAANIKDEIVNVVIYKGWYNEIGISTREEFNKLCQMSDADYSINESHILFEISDKSVLLELIDCLTKGHIYNESYDIIVENMIDILSRGKKQILK